MTGSRWLNKPWWWLTCPCYRWHGCHDAFYAAGHECLWCGAEGPGA